MKKTFIFELARIDEWRTPWVKCPVCGNENKHDGVIKHIIRKAELGSDEHRAWLTEYHVPRRRNQQVAKTGKKKRGIIKKKKL